MDIAAAPDGRIATASFDNSVGLWTGDAPDWLEGHEAAVNTVVFNGTAIYSAGDDFTLRRWPDGKVIGQHKGKVVSVAATDTHVATASWDGTIGIWPSDGSPSRLLGPTGSGVNAVAFSTDGRHLYSTGVDGTLRIWDVETGDETRRLVQHGFGINELVLNEADGWLAYGAVDGVTRVLDLTTGEERDFTLERRPSLLWHSARIATCSLLEMAKATSWSSTRRNGGSPRDFRATLRGPVWALAFSPDGENIHAGGIDDAMYSWPVASLNEHGQMPQANAAFCRIRMK